MKPITPKFPKGSIAYFAHRRYIKHVWDSLLYSIGGTFVKNSHIWLDMRDGLLAIFKLIILLVLMIFSPLLSWVFGYVNMRNARRRFNDLDGVYAGRLDHLNEK